MITNFLGSFIGSFILEISGYMEILEAVTAGASEAELMAVVMEHIGGLAVYFLYALCIIGFVIAGIILFVTNKKNFKLTAGEIPIQKGQQAKTLLWNLGMVLYSAFWIVQIILQLTA